MPLFAFVGDDELRKQEALDAAVSRWQNEGDCVRESHFGEELQWQVIAASFNTTDLFAARKAILLRNFDKAPSSAQKQLEEVFGSDNDQVAVFISATKLDGRGTLAKRLKAAKALEEFKLPYDNQVPQWLTQRAKDRYGRKLGMVEAKLLQERIGNDLAELDHELEKLDTFLQKGATIAPEDILEVVASLRESPIWELQRTMGLRQRTEAFLALRNLLDSGEEGFLIAMQLFRHFQRLLRIRMLLDRGANEGEIEQAFALNRFLHIVKERMFEQARSRSVETWKRLLARLARLEWELKQGRFPHRFEIELAFAGMV